MALDLLERRLGVEPAPEHHRRSEPERRHRPDQAEEVKQRRRDHEWGPGLRHPPDSPDVEQARERHRRERLRADRARGALRGAGRARRHHHHPPGRFGGGRVGCAFVDQFGDRRPQRLVALAPGDDPGPVEAGGLKQRLKLLVVDRSGDAFALEHLAELRCGEVATQRHEVTPEPRRGDRRVQESAVVAAHDRDPVVGSDPLGGVQRARERAGLVVQLVEPDRAALVDHGRAAGIQLGGGRGDARGGRPEPARGDQRPSQRDRGGSAARPGRRRSIRARRARRAASLRRLRRGGEHRSTRRVGEPRRRPAEPGPVRRDRPGTERDRPGDDPRRLLARHCGHVVPDPERSEHRRADQLEVDRGRRDAIRASFRRDAGEPHFERRLRRDVCAPAQRREVDAHRRDADDVAAAALAHRRQQPEQEPHRPEVVRVDRPLEVVEAAVGLRRASGGSRGPRWRRPRRRDRGARARRRRARPPRRCRRGRTDIRTRSRRRRGSLARAPRATRGGGRRAAPSRRRRPAAARSRPRPPRTRR